MTQREQYDNAFIEAFSIEKKDLGDQLEYESIQEWDSIGHMAIIGTLEDTFNIVMDMSDIIDFSSYNKGIEILVEKYNLDL